MIMMMMMKMVLIIIMIIIISSSSSSIIKYWLLFIFHSLSNFTHAKIHAHVESVTISHKIYH